MYQVGFDSISYDPVRWTHKTKHDSPSALRWPRPTFLLAHLAETACHADGTTRNLSGGQRRLDCPERRFLEEQKPGSYVVATFFARSRSTQIIGLGRSTFETTQSSMPKAAEHRSCCAPTVFLRGVYQGCSASRPRLEDPCRPSQPSTHTAVVENFCPPQKKTEFLVAHWATFLAHPSYGSRLI